MKTNNGIERETSNIESETDNGFFFHEWVTPITPFIILTNYYMQKIVYV